MNKLYIFFRIIFFMVAILHCMELVKNSFIEIEELETYNIEITDSSDSDSEEKKEEQEIMDIYCSKEFKSSSYNCENNSSQISFLFYQFNIQTQVQTVLESPPENRLS